MDALISLIIPILKRYGITKASLFGSYARGDNSFASDLDVLIQPTPKMSLLDLIHVEKEISSVLRKPVDVITYKSIHPLLRDHILRDSKAIL